jgi:hypothetical protein
MHELSLALALPTAPPVADVTADEDPLGHTAYPSCEQFQRRHDGQPPATN